MNRNSWYRQKSLPRQNGDSASFSKKSSGEPPVFELSVLKEEHTEWNSKEIVERSSLESSRKKQLEKENDNDDTSSILSISPKSIIIEAAPPSSDKASGEVFPFVKHFRGSAHYIANHRDSIAVYHLPVCFVMSSTASSSATSSLVEFMDDVALTWVLGMKIVLVVGSDSIKGNPSGTHHPISTEDLHSLESIAGRARFEIERHLGRALRLHREKEGGNIISGNFYSAQPFGVRNGVDYNHFGLVRKVFNREITGHLSRNDVVVLTSVGSSPSSGDVYSVNGWSLSSAVAGSLKASKIVYVSPHGQVILRHKVTSKIIQSLRLNDARALAASHGCLVSPTTGLLTNGIPLAGDAGITEALLQISYATHALSSDVKRAHIISPKDGSILQELYTRDGAGTMIAGNVYDGMRRAKYHDVPGILRLVEPHARAGILKERTPSQIEAGIKSYYVYTRDSLILAVGQLERFENARMEIGCLVVAKDYRSQGKGDAMLSFLERVSLRAGARVVFVLSTQSMDWFLERNYEEAGVEMLPHSRRSSYDYTRKSKIYRKEITERGLDATELTWT